MIKLPSSNNMVSISSAMYAIVITSAMASIIVAILYLVMLATMRSHWDSKQADTWICNMVSLGQGYRWVRLLSLLSMMICLRLLL